MNRNGFPGISVLCAVLPLASLLLFPLIGCGGGHRSGASVPAALTGRAQFTVRWPEPSRLIPSAAQSIRVSLHRGDTLLGERLLVRTASGGETSVVLDGLPVGEITVRVAAYPTLDGTGTAQAGARTIVETRPGEIVPVRMSLATTIAAVDITSTSGRLRAGDSTRLSATAKSADGEIVLTNSNTIAWTSSAPEIATVDLAGTVIAVAPGNVTIRASETESGKVGERTFEILPGPLKNADIPGLALRFRSADAKGAPNLTKWDDASDNNKDVNSFGADVTVIPDAFGAGIPGVNIGNSGLGFVTVEGIRTIYVVVKGGTNYAGIDNWGPVVGQSEVSRGRAFQGEYHGLAGAVRYISGEPRVYSDSEYLTRTWQNGQPTLENALNVSPNEVTLLTLELPTAYPFDSLARDYNGFVHGGRWTYGEVILSTQAHTTAQREAIQNSLMADYNIDPDAPLHHLVIEMGDSIGYGYWGGNQASRLAAKLNGARLAAGQPVEWDTASVGHPGKTVFLDGAGKEAHRAMMARVFSANRGKKVYLGSKGTNDIGSYSPSFARTSAQTIDAIVDEVAAARAAGANYAIYRTLLDRGAYGGQITGTDFPGDTEQERKQAEFDTKRETVNAFLRSRVYPAGHALAGQSLLDAISDAGAQTIPTPVTVTDGTALVAGAPNPVGRNGATGTEGMYKYWAAQYGQRGTSATANNDRIHPSDLGADILTASDYAALRSALGEP